VTRAGRVRARPPARLAAVRASSAEPGLRQFAPGHRRSSMWSARPPGHGLVQRRSFSAAQMRSSVSNCSMTTCRSDNVRAASRSCRRLLCARLPISTFDALRCRNARTCFAVPGARSGSHEFHCRNQHRLFVGDVPEYALNSGRAYADQLSSRREPLNHARWAAGSRCGPPRRAAASASYDRASPGRSIPKLLVEGCDSVLPVISADEVRGRHQDHLAA